MKLFAGSLLRRIVSSFFALSAVIVVLLTCVAYAVIVGDARRAVVGQLDTLANAKTQALESWMRESYRRVEFAATMDSIGAVATSGEPRRDAIRAALSAIKSRWPELGELLFAADQGGLVLAATAPELEGHYRVHETWFVRGKEGVHVQSVYPSPVTLRPTLTVSAPVFGPSGARLGVFAADLDLGVAEGIVGELSGPYPTAEAYLVDRYSVFVSAGRYGDSAYPRGAHSPGIDAAIAGASGSGVYTDYRGVPVIGAYRWLPEYEVALIVEVPSADAFRSARRQTAVIAGVGTAVVVALAVGVLLLARRIVSPILAIEEASRKLAAGDLGARAPVVTKDEIGSLARSFNDMAENLGDLYAVLQWNEERFRSLIEASTDVIVLTNADGSVSFVSPSVERQLGYAPAALLGKSVLNVVHPEDVDRAREAIFHGLAGASAGQSLSIELRIRDKKGSWHTVEALAKNLLDHPAVHAILVNSRDISERRHLETELAQAQKMEAVGRLAGGIAHDFNNLLTAIMGYAEIVAGTPGLPAEAAEGAREITRAADRAAGLTQQLLAYSRKQVLQPRILDLNDLIAETGTLLRRVIGEHITIRTILDPDLPCIAADPSQLERVVVNLAVNARDAMPYGGTLTIQTRSVTSETRDVAPDLTPGTYVLAEISDTGVGMDEATLGRLFEPFFTTKEVGKGTGLGLATVYGIVRQSGGHVTVRSAVGKGTTFSLYFPASTIDGAQAEPAREPADPTAGTESILLVEDEEAVARLMRETLTRAGYHVVSTSDPTEAPGLALDAGGFDLLVTDIVMPGMDGGHLASLLREQHPAMRVLFVSGYTADERLRHGVLADELAFLQKPFAPATLVRRVRETLDHAPRG